MSAPKHPTSVLVARAWLALIPGITPAMTGTSLPRIGTNTLPNWCGTGFLTVQTVGGSPDIETLRAMPVVSVKCWAVNATQPAAGGPVAVQAKVPWARSEQLAEMIRHASYPLQRAYAPRLVTMPVAGYAQASIQGAYLLTEPRPLQDPAGYACHQVDVQLTWVTPVVVGG
jgi:hypothetical protein